MPPCVFIFTVGSVLPAIALRSRSTPESNVNDLQSYTFERFVLDFERSYQQGTEEWTNRKELFSKRRSEMIEFNALPDQSWKMGISKFMDYTETERKGSLGYTGRGRKRSVKEVSSAATALQRSERLPQTFFVARSQEAKKRSTKLIDKVRDQGSCGSCWAEAATATLEGQMEANSTLMDQLAMLREDHVPKVPTLSSQTIVSCTPNPRNCGGSGGCGGATVELAYGMMKERGGVPFASDWPYEGRNRACREDLFSHHKIGITGFTVLPSNKQQPLLQAIVSTGGPIAVAADATDWFNYGNGVYKDGKDGKFTVNHAITLVGYKMPEDGKMGWYQIKNSWGSFWGEKGHIRIEMKPEDEKHCGWDYDTHIGIACDGDPDTAWVCGTSGILYDSVFPTGLHFKRGA